FRPAARAKAFPTCDEGAPPRRDTTHGAGESAPPASGTARGIVLAPAMVAGTVAATTAAAAVEMTILTECNRPICCLPIEVSCRPVLGCSGRVVARLILKQDLCTRTSHDSGNPAAIVEYGRNAWEAFLLLSARRPGLQPGHRAGAVRPRSTPKYGVGL